MPRANLDRVPPRADRRVCDYPSCGGVGEFRAPRSPRALNSYYWFCLDHVREYNAGWDFFDGMSEAEIQEFQRNDIHGHRPTWRFGSTSDPDWSQATWGDGFGFVDGGNGNGGEDRVNGHKFHAGEHHALALMNLEWPVTLKELKERYKELVKLHHPDANGGSKESEERLKKINLAYSLLLSCGYH